MAQGMRWDRDERYGDRDRGEDWRQRDSSRDEERSFGGSSERHGGGAYGGQGRSYGGGASYGQGRYSAGGRGGYGAGGRGYGDERRYGQQERGGYGSEYGDYGGSGYGADSYGGGAYGASSYRGDYDRNRRGSEQGGRDTGFGAGGAYRQGYGGQRVESGGMFGGYEGNTGEHRGRGPKNYTRSDDRIREDVHDRLTDDAWLDASHIDVQVKDGEVTLSGTVEDRRDKRRAEDLVDDCSGVKHVQNNLRIENRDDTRSGGTYVDEG